MRIQPFVSDPSTRFAELAPSADAQPRPPSPAGAATSEQASGHVRSAELSGLLAQLRQQPEVRQDLMAQVAQGLANGQYDSPAAAAQTAAAILQAPE